MSHGNRSQLADAVTVLFVAAILFFAAWAVWDWSASYTRNAIEADQGSRHYAADAQERIKRECTAPATISDCVAKIIQATQENQRAEYDLSAQQDMAKWAWWMVAVSLLATIVTAIGIWFVRENLLAVREANAGTMRAVAAAERANEIAFETAKHQTRAYISIQGVRLKKYQAGSRAEAKAEIVNSGNTPAKEVKAVIEIFLLPFTEEGHFDADINQGSSKSSLGKDARIIHKIATSQTLGPADIYDLAARKTGLFVSVFVAYKDIYGQDWLTKGRFVNNQYGSATNKMGDPEEWVTMNVCSEGNEST